MTIYLWNWPLVKLTNYHFHLYKSLQHFWKYSHINHSLILQLINDLFAINKVRTIAKFKIFVMRPELFKITAFIIYALFREIYLFFFVVEFLIVHINIIRCFLFFFQLVFFSKQFLKQNSSQMAFLIINSYYLTSFLLWLLQKLVYFCIIIINTNYYMQLLYIIKT